jgi:hypothetical protein
MEQIANLSTGNCRQGSSPCLSAIKVRKRYVADFFLQATDSQTRFILISCYAK